MATHKRSTSGRVRSDGHGKGGRTIVPPAPNAIPLTFSSGHRAFLKPLPYQTFLKLRQRESELYPEPPIPQQVIETDSGEIKINASRDSVEGLDYLIRVNEVAGRRAEFRLDFIIDHFLVIEGAETEEGIAELVRQYDADLRALAVLSDDGIPEGEEWAYVVRHFILQSAQDYEVLQEQATSLCTPVTGAEVAERVKMFRSFMAGQTANGDRRASGAEGTDGGPVQ